MPGRDWDRLYQLQDWVLARLAAVAHEFYLSGGTALSRGYYAHRYSDDLDFFVNDAPEFPLWRDRCLDALGRAGVLKVQGTTLDCGYLDPWAHELGLAELLRRALEDAGLP